MSFWGSLSHRSDLRNRHSLRVNRQRSEYDHPGDKPQRSGFHVSPPIRSNQSVLIDVLATFAFPAGMNLRLHGGEVNEPLGAT